MPGFLKLMLVRLLKLHSCSGSRSGAFLAKSADSLSKFSFLASDVDKEGFKLSQAVMTLINLEVEEVDMVLLEIKKRLPVTQTLNNG